MSSGHLWWAVRRLRYQWLQAVFIVVGLALGVAVFTTVTTQLVNSRRDIRRIAEKDPSLQQVMVTPKQRAAEAMGPEAPVARLVTDDEQTEELPSLTLADFLDVRENVPGVRYSLLDRVITGMPAVARDDEPLADTDVMLQRVTPDQFQVDEAQLLAGTFFTWDDFVAARSLLVVDESWVRGYFPELSSPGEAVGHAIVTAGLGGPDAAGRKWTIVGVVADPDEDAATSGPGRRSGRASGGRFRGQRVTGNAYVPDTALSVLHGRARAGGSSMMAVTARSEPVTDVSAIDPGQVTYYNLVFWPEPDVPPEMLATRIQAYLDAKLGRERFEVFSPVQRMAEALRGQWRVFAALAGLASLALFIGAVNVLNLNLAHVLQRQRLIGLSAALGASRRQLVGQSLVEALFLGLGGGLLGALLTVPGLRLLFLFQAHDVPEASRAQLALAYQADPWMLLAGVTLGGAISLLFGLVPTWQASHISPAEVLRE